MGCLTCFMKSSREKATAKTVGTCAVCAGIDNDASKKDVFYCSLCQEWICDDCKNRLIGRGWLALKKLFIEIKK